MCVAVYNHTGIFLPAFTNVYVKTRVSNQMCIHSLFLSYVQTHINRVE